MFAFALLLFYPMLSFAQTPPIGIDGNILPGQSVTGVVRFSGFAQAAPLVDSVQLAVFSGGSPVYVGTATYPINRADVPNAGFVFDLDTDQFPNGTYTVRVMSFKSGGTVAQTTRDVNVARVPHMGNIEMPAAGSTVSNVLGVGGWAIAEQGFTDLTLFVNGVATVPVLWAVSDRPDVLAAFPGYGISRAAFNTRAEIANLPQGPARLSLWGTSGTGKLDKVATTDVVINKNLDAQGVIDSPQYGQAVDATKPVAVTGWVSAQKPLAKIRVYVNDRLVSETSSGFGDRPDVKGKFAQRAYAQSFSVSIPDTSLIPGVHNYRIEAQDSAGNLLTVPAPNGLLPIINVKASKRMLGAHLRPENDYTTTINRFSAQIGRVPDYVLYFQGFLDEKNAATTFNTYPFLPNQVRNKGASPLVSWVSLSAGGPDLDPNYRLDYLLDGRFDAYIRGFARQVRDFGAPVVFRFEHEFNGQYYSWGGAAGMGNSPAKYIQMWRKVVNMFKEEGAINARFMWSPNYIAPPQVTGPAADFRNYYPGDAYVDFIGVSGYNWGTDPVRGAAWTLPPALYENFLRSVARSYPTKPVIINEIGTVPSYGSYSAPNWIRDAFSMFGLYTNLKGVVWFNDMAYASSNGADFRVANTTSDLPSVDPAVTAAFVAYGVSWASGPSTSGQ